MLQGVLTFAIVQCMFLAIGIFGGVEIGTFDAGILCFLSQLVGVVVAVVEYMARLHFKTAKKL